jgi:hypothetical protein
MSTETLNDIITKVSGVVSQTITVTATSNEYGLWRSYVNMAQKEWAESYDWPSLFVDYYTKTTTLGLTSISLPADFRKLSSFPQAVYDGTTTKTYNEIDPQKQSQYTTDDYCYILSSNAATNLVLNPVSMLSGVSLHIPYWRSPASLVSPADKIDCPDSEYLVQRTIAYIWESREDGRFPQAKVEAEKILSRLLENELTKGMAYDNKIQTPEERNYSFRVGRD